MENYLKQLLNLSPEDGAAWVQQMAMHAPPPGELPDAVGGVQPVAQVQQVPQVAPQGQAPVARFGNLLNPQTVSTAQAGTQTAVAPNFGQGVALPDALTAGQQQTTLSKLLGG